MILEGIITTEDPANRMHVAPIGPHVDRSLESWSLKPFQTSTTFSNLHRTSRGVFHIVDDALLLVQSVLGISNQVGAEPQAIYHEGIGWILSGACRAYPLQVTEWDVSQPRAVARCQAGKPLEIRPFWGWNRAAHSLLELAVLWSRRDLLEAVILKEEFQRHRIIIEKTAGDRELTALSLLDEQFKNRFEQT
jgi:hypothetical protein